MSDNRLNRFYAAVANARSPPGPHDTLSCGPVLRMCGTRDWQFCLNRAVNCAIAINSGGIQYG
jgi:hypothetical protein